MRKNIGAAVFVAVLCLGVTASAEDGVKVGKDGSVKVKTGGTRVEVKTGGQVSIHTPDTQVETSTQDPDSDASGSREVSSQIKILGSERKETITCAKQTEVSISGSDNELTLEGECKSVSVTGSTNKVKVESTGRLTVTGADNMVTWKRGNSTVKKPKISSTGSNNSVSQEK